MNPELIKAYKELIELYYKSYDDQYLEEKRQLRSRIAKLEAEGEPLLEWLDERIVLSKKEEGITGREYYRGSIAAFEEVKQYIESLTNK